jgi:hypothetical protein
MDEHDLINRFTHHSPKIGQSERYDQLRDGARLVAKLIVDLTPSSREQDLAITRLEESLFWAIAAIARHE